MFPSSARGNNPERWEKFLTALDEKLQLGLLDYLKRVQSYHFEEDVLFVVPGNADDLKYLQKDSVFQQLQILAQDATRVTTVKVKAV